MTAALLAGCAEDAEPTADPGADRVALRVGVGAGDPVETPGETPTRDPEETTETAGVRPAGLAARLASRSRDRSTTRSRSAGAGGSPRRRRVAGPAVRARRGDVHPAAGLHLHRRAARRALRRRRRAHDLASKPDVAEVVDLSNGGATRSTAGRRRRPSSAAPGRSARASWSTPPRTAATTAWRPSTSLAGRGRDRPVRPAAPRLQPCTITPAGTAVMTFDDGRPSCRTLNRVEGELLRRRSAASPSARAGTRRAPRPPRCGRRSPTRSRSRPRTSSPTPAPARTTSAPARPGRSPGAGTRRTSSATRSARASRPGWSGSATARPRSSTSRRAAATRSWRPPLRRHRPHGHRVHRRRRRAGHHPAALTPAVGSPDGAVHRLPLAALDFYDDLEVDNTRSFWEKHKGTYDYSVRAPMVALVAALEPEFGEAKVFRPYRDVRFAKDKTPYKTHQGAFVAVGPAPAGTSRSRPAASAPAPASTTPPARGWPASAAGDRRRPARPAAGGGLAGWPTAGSRSAATRSRPAPAGTPPTTRGSSCCATSR